MSVADENAQLNEMLAGHPDPATSRDNRNEGQLQPSPPRQSQDLDLCQWQVSPNGIFRPAARTVSTLEPGVYTTGGDERGIYLKRQTAVADFVVELPGSANIRVLAAIRKFWESRARYVAHGLVFKRGVFLYGPPGSGKSIGVLLLTRDLVARGGIIVYASHPKLMVELMQAIRRIEPERPLIVVLEDIDEIISDHGEHQILAMLDGEHQTDNVVFIATSNYPERLGARIINRPSRFDDRIFVGMPAEAARLAYLRHATGDSAVAVDWARDTAGLSIAHLRELVAAVLCLDQPYEEVLARLKTMNERPKEFHEFGKRQTGFGQAAAGELAGTHR